METRECLNDHLSSMANLQFRKSFPIPESEKAVTETSKHLSKLFQPQRKFKKVVDPNESLPLEKQVLIYYTFLYINYSIINSEE